MTSPAPIYCKKDQGRLVPVSQDDAELISEYPADTDLEIKIKRKRSTKQHRLYWQILNRVVKATGRYPTAEHLHNSLKLECGYWQPVVKLNGETYRIPDSASFDKMDQQQFQNYFNAAMLLISEHLLDGQDPVALVKGAQ